MLTFRSQCSDSMPSAAGALLLFLFVSSAGVTVGYGQTIDTRVGTGVEGSNLGSTGSTTSLSAPAGVHADSLGVYVADTGNNRILYVDDATDTPITIAGTGDAGFSGDESVAVLAELNGPTGVFVVSSGNVYIVDSGNHRIRMIDDESGEISTFAGNGEAGSLGDGEAATDAQLSAPSQVFVTDDEDSVFIADTGNHRIRLVTGGNIATFAGTGVAGFFGDDSLAVEAQLHGPSGVFRDLTSGRVYIADTNNHRIRFVSSDTMHSFAGTSVPSYGGDGGPPAAAQLAFPKDVFADKEGNVYIADTFNQRVRRVNRRGTVTTVAGDGVFGFAGDDGPSNHAQMRSPASVSVDSLGRIMVADRDNHRIRRIDPDNVVLHGGIGAPDRETALLSIGFTGDGVSSVDSLGLTLFGSPSFEVNSEGDSIKVDSQGDSIRVDLARDFVEFKLYESFDAAFSNSDVLAGSIASSEVMLGVPFTIGLVPPATPSFGTQLHYVVTALVETTARYIRKSWMG